MKLTNVTQQGRLLYFSNGPDAITVSENAAYRWLSFGTVMQSLMLKRQPWRLTLPHHYALMLPLAWFKPCNVMEFGLGGGNVARFLMHWANCGELVLHMTSIERSTVVQHCFLNYFCPPPDGHQVLVADAADYMHADLLAAHDWFIYDIFQLADPVASKSPVAQSTRAHCQQLSANLPDYGCLSINIPLSTGPELQLILRGLKLAAQGRLMWYAKVPHYRNVIVHILGDALSQDIAQQQSFHGYLPQPWQRRMQSWWQYGISH